MALARAGPVLGAPTEGLGWVLSAAGLIKIGKLTSHKWIEV